ncbi:MAG: hypothetical protein WBB98_07160 [Xanthobacteraceae bacterium]
MRVGEIRAARRAAIATGSRKNGLIGGDREQRGELIAGHSPVLTEIERNIGKRTAAGIEHRIDSDRRLIVEQNDQLLADPHESQLLARDVAEIELGVAVEMNGDGLAVLRLFKFQILWRSGRLRSRTGKLCNQNGSVHRRNPQMNSAAQNGRPN